MTSLTLAARDSATMFRRNLKQQLRYPTIVYQVASPIVILLLFVHVFGETIGTGLGAASGGRAAYLDYIVPGILLITVGMAGAGIAISVSNDATKGIIDRFRTMAIARGSVLTGHVLGNVLQTMLAVAVVLAVAVLSGFRPSAGAGEWLAVTGTLTAITLAVAWLSVALGLVAKSIESASNLPMPLMLLPFFGSGFVPTESMSTGLRWFAEYQPFTPMIELVRGLLAGTAIGNAGWLTLAWTLAIGLFGYIWSKRLFHRDRSR